MKKITRLFFYLAVCFCLYPSAGKTQQLDVASINTELLKNQWSANWISHPADPGSDYGVFLFRKNIDLKNVPSKFIVHVSADNRYRFFVNGKAVCFGPARGDIAHWFYESIDIAPFLKGGKNLLAAEVWNFGNVKGWAQVSLKTGFIVQGNSDGEAIVNTDSSWKVIRNQAYEPIPASTEYTIFESVVGPTDRLNGCLYPWAWETNEFYDNDWLQCKVISKGQPASLFPKDTWGLTPRRLPMMEQSVMRLQEVRYSNGCMVPPGFITGKDKWVVPTNSKVIVLFDQGQLTTGYPQLLASGGKGSKVKMTYAESLFDQWGSKANRDEVENKNMKGYFDCFLPDGGNKRLFSPLWFRTWRYLELEIETKDEPLAVDNFESLFTAYPLKEIGSFDSDNDKLKKIWNVGWRTARLCANETYFDCPYYEQLQYVGDTRIQSLISLYVAGDDRLMRNSIRQYSESIIGEGLTQSRYPSSMLQVIPPFSLFWVDMIHDYHILRDDPEFVKEFLPRIDRVLAWFVAHINPKTGMLGKLEHWNFVDWVPEWNNGVPMDDESDGNSSILSLQFVYALQRAAELNEFFGNFQTANYYKLQAQKISKATYDNCWDKKQVYLADAPGKDRFSMHAQILAVLTNTIPADQQKSFVDKFIADTSLLQPTMYFRFYLAQALQQVGLVDRYLQTLGLWEDMLQKGMSTFAECPDPTRSDCHAWSASPNYDFLATVAGIRPSAPGFKTVRIEPALGELNVIKGQMAHPKGVIRFELKRCGAYGITGFVQLPAGVEGIFVWQGKKLKIKNKTRIKIIPDFKSI